MVWVEEEVSAAEEAEELSSPNSWASSVEVWASEEGSVEAVAATEVEEDVVVEHPEKEAQLEVQARVTRNEQWFPVIESLYSWLNTIKILAN